MLVDSGNPDHLVVEKRIDSFLKVRICTQFLLWLRIRSSVVRAFKDPGLNAGGAALCFFFHLIQLSSSTFVGEKEENLISMLTYWGEPQRAPKLRVDLAFRHSLYIFV